MFLFLHRFELRWINIKKMERNDEKKRKTLMRQGSKPSMSTEKFLFWKGPRWLEEEYAQSTLLLVYSVAYRLLLNLPLGVLSKSTSIIPGSKFVGNLGRDEAVVVRVVRTLSRPNNFELSTLLGFGNIAAATGAREGIFCGRLRFCVEAVQGDQVLMTTAR